MRSESPKQAKRRRLLSERKRDRIQAQIDEAGYAWCEGCGVPVASTVEEAMTKLQGHHKKHRGMGASYNRPGIDDDDNILLLEERCHRREHA